MGKMYRARFINDAYFNALEELKSVAVGFPLTQLSPVRPTEIPLQKAHDLSLTEIGLRWLQHHSVLQPGDGVILGASSATQLEQNIVDR